ncbi:hypothetical protein PIB30_091213 [Stylosanthes scabra]|uniref:Uncharacterized protein n=1 Tax=Stylosanthes scabra TaxID=79078 RepID=A0ABU6ZT45_9FABA|nr:hypothetical protein [Stylosanthes scabra]
MLYVTTFTLSSTLQSRLDLAKPSPKHGHTHTLTFALALLHLHGFPYLTPSPIPCIPSLITPLHQHSPCIQAYHALLSRLAWHQCGPCFNPTFSTKLHTQSPVHPFPSSSHVWRGKDVVKASFHHPTFLPQARVIFSHPFTSCLASRLVPLTRVIKPT